MVYAGSSNPNANSHTSDEVCGQIGAAAFVGKPL